MNAEYWKQIKKSIIDDLKARELKQPSRRLNEIERVENCLRSYFPDIYSDPTLLKRIPKNDFKRKYAHARSKPRLSGAESSLINEIYKRI